ncbi:MAG: hypothetical protein COW24_02965 [Candidatus Kerfeldbacteria bacterium CG15_BIG_FIL_POST_REV_8_21_14_020_45_12]|uniref:Uncharacterized protein n=1 Tax=Candidatus Kerfeldbacteria bacterium CG15_BIG_FIL_POST_REV_8_21_14_020_45_12 TaxID=2014247 RepID=A0A2M7H3V6_9BACT|nr:MAG: hypothetical protein COW24_02965 [Candidatus Kerfeldbacteria bacterium CG15_BIG_FIL_POST_REV_8_21_14_020_45_12]PJA94018.1 MAG: hypothetical protein CO132_00535 [Candidatus Kerfeldbacteria bacterium CG_4_9_14_3_um_filter_45_8]
MRLSALQQYILSQTLEEGGRVGRTLFLVFYEGEERDTKEQLRGKIITHSIERLIDRGYLIGHGHRTQEKWFIDKVSLTPAGTKEARLLIAQQQTLPLKKRSARKNGNQ